MTFIIGQKGFHKGRILILCAAMSAAFGADKGDALLKHLRSIQQLDICGEQIPLDNQEVRERFEKEMLLALDNESQIILWLKRTSRYFPYIEAELNRRHLPDDLKYLPVIESALQPHIGSSRGALGFWQFTKETGTSYGLLINSQIDERRNFQLSTIAALKHLRALNHRFGNWTLALAAYNLGDGNLQEEIQRQGTKDYYNLYLPIETQRFLLKIAAAKLIISHPARFGFHLKKGDAYPAVNATMTRFTTDRRIPIKCVADAAQTTLKKIKDLNPHIRGYTLESGEWKLMIPPQDISAFKHTLSDLISRMPPEQAQQFYIVQPGDNLTKIAEANDISLSDLLRWNIIKAQDDIHPGDKLKISE